MMSLTDSENAKEATSKGDFTNLEPAFTIF
jgi:hypothetical protein